MQHRTGPGQRVDALEHCCLTPIAQTQPHAQSASAMPPVQAGIRRLRRRGWLLNFAALTRLGMLWIGYPPFRAAASFSASTVLASSGAMGCRCPSAGTDVGCAGCCAASLLPARGAGAVAFRQRTGAQRECVRDPAALDDRTFTARPSRCRPSRCHAGVDGGLHLVRPLPPERCV